MNFFAAKSKLRSKIEEGVNAVLKAELAGFLGYEKHSSAGWHAGNSRNGSYQRTIVTSYGKITMDVPRDRNGEFLISIIANTKATCRFVGDYNHSTVPTRCHDASNRGAYRANVWSLLHASYHIQDCS